MLKIAMWLVTAMIAVAIAFGTITVIFAGKSPKELAWEDILTTFIGVWMIGCIPVSLMRWVAIPEARIEGRLSRALITMAVGGASFVTPVLSQGRIDPAYAFGFILVLCTVQIILSVWLNRDADELMRRYNTDSAVISSAILLGAFSIYAAAERLGVIGVISPWGLVGIACIIQFVVSMYVYYRLGLNPEAQEKQAG